jgi:hypothetical protein
VLSLEDILKSYFVLKGLFINSIFVLCRDANIRTHLKSVYASLAMSITSAAAGAYVHLFTDLVLCKPL